LTKVDAGFFFLEVARGICQDQEIFGARERSRAASEIPDVSPAEIPDISSR
jgi:hypothetical protein